MRDRRKEGQLIKRAIKKALPDVDKITVRAGQGTAYGWWDIGIDDKPALDCSCTYESWGTRNTCQPCGDKLSHIHQTAERAVINSGAQISNHYPDMGGERNNIIIQTDLRQPQPETKAARS